MMRRIFPFLLVLGVLGAFGGTLVLLYKKSQPKPTPYQMFVFWLPTHEPCQRGGTRAHQPQLR